MVALRSRRLETLLGTRLEDVDYRHVQGFVAGQIAEDFDLDYKATMYGGSDRDKRDLATDIAALANTAGGLLVLGIEEDEQARAKAAPGVDISDDQRSRIGRVVASGVFPLPTFDVVPLEDPARPGWGFLLVVVPRSPLAPHAVLVNEGFRYPRRNGATTRYLSEPEVANEYRARFGRGLEQVSRAERIESEAVNRLDVDGTLWLVVSLTPDNPGEYLINRASQLSLQREIINQKLGMTPLGSEWKRVSAGRRRLLADAGVSGSRAQWLACELHDDGAGVFAATVARAGRASNLAGEPNRTNEYPVDDEELVNVIVSGLQFLGHHARDRAAVRGDALVRAFLHPLGDPRNAYLAHWRRHGTEQRIGSHILTRKMSPTEQVVPLDSIADAGRELISAAFPLANELVQAFGYPEVAQLTRSGALRRRYWDIRIQPAVLRWASERRIEVIDDVLD